MFYKVFTWANERHPMIGRHVRGWYLNYFTADQEAAECHAAWLRGNGVKVRIESGRFIGAGSTL
jgi:hypothetical protein